MSSDPGRTRRRLVSLSALCVASVLAATVAPLWLLCALVLDGLTDRRFPRTRASAFFALYLGCEVAGVLGAAAIAHRRGPGAVAAFAALQRWWTSTLFFGAARVFGMRVHVEGEAAAAPGPALFFVRHSSAADTVVVAALVTNPRRILLRYVLKRDLLWDPCLDLVGQRLPNVFVARDKASRDADLAAVAGLADGLGPDDGVLIYPEGTRFSEGKRARALEALAEQPDLRALAEPWRHVLPPRLGGPLALLDSGLDVVFVDQTGFEGSATLASLWRGGLIGTTVAVRLRRVPAAEIPGDDRARWLFQQWAQTEAWVAARAR